MKTMPSKPSAMTVYRYLFKRCREADKKATQVEINRRASFAAFMLAVRKYDAWGVGDLIADAAEEAVDFTRDTKPARKWAKQTSMAAFVEEELRDECSRRGFDRDVVTGHRYELRSDIVGKCVNDIMSALDDLRYDEHGIGYAIDDAIEECRTGRILAAIA